MVENILGYNNLKLENRQNGLRDENENMGSQISYLYFLLRQATILTIGIKKTATVVSISIYLLEM